MEHKRIKLTTASYFQLEETELSNMYLALALFQHQNFRHPEYSEYLAIKQLHKDIKKYYAELQVQFLKQPNNLMIYKMLSFFDKHLHALQLIVDKKEGYMFLGGAVAVYEPSQRHTHPHHITPTTPSTSKKSRKLANFLDFLYLFIKFSLPL